ncbi:MAG: nitroreductase family protein [Candidatus Eisenbacteria bacterium]|nr:nitroreductase family protein [Candidatus Latescibacterota bacterium]MBD3303097.1 nitroreductase family protein [Candidatus Eisenbacteria bacterium]
MTSEPSFHPLEYERPTVEEQRRAIVAFHRTMRTRRTVRRFSADPVPRDLVDTAIAVANDAPSGANLQPWHFALVGDPAVKREIRRGAEREERENYERRFPDEWKEKLVAFGTDWRKEFLEIAPWLVVVFRVDWSEGPDGGRQKHYYVSESVGIAVGFLLAALHTAGLATLTHTPSPMGFLARILGRGRNEKPYLLIPVGYPARDCTVPAIEKRDLDAVRTLFIGSDGSA